MLSSQDLAASFVEDPVSIANLELEEEEAGSAGKAVGVSAAWRKLLVQAEMAAPHLQVATIEGEHGSGKYTLARYIFSHSPHAGTQLQRRDACEWLATVGDAARVEGYLYLDRVDRLTPPGQNVLLGVLRSLQERVPGRQVLLASAQTPLRQMAAQRQFLPELTYRLTAIRFVVPPLRQRRDDIAPLAEALLRRLCVRYHHGPVVLGRGSLARLLEHDWPGNVRELAGTLESALLESMDDVIRPEDLSLIEGLESQTHIQSQAPVPDLSMDAIIRNHVRYVLDLNRGNKLRAARQLGISRSTIYRILGNGSSPGA
jgi:DNA-binding NtrC family response regulator